MSKSKKILASLLAGAMLAAAPVALPTDSAPALDYSVASAAKGGAKFSAPKPAPKASAPKSNAASSKSSQSKSVSGNGKNYKPSKDAKSLEKNAPGTNAAAKGSTAAAAAQSSTGWGSALRQMGILAGGMFLGSMLSHLFLGAGGGILGDVLGVLVNILLFAALFMAIRWAWNRFRGRSSGSSYSGSSWQSRPSGPVDVTPRDSQGRPVYQDIKQVDSGEYSAKSMADRYRNR